MVHTRVVRKDECWFCICLGLAFCVFFWFSLDYFVLVLFAFVVLSLISLVLSQEIGWEEHLLK